MKVSAKIQKLTRLNVMAKKLLAMNVKSAEQADTRFIKLVKINRKRTKYFPKNNRELIQMERIAL